MRDNREGHTGFSIGMTQRILNRLIDRKVLTPVEDTEDEWIMRAEHDTYKMYQSKRMGSLFKYATTDGHVSYRDVERYYGIDIANPNAGFRTGLFDRILDETFPIILPYMPNDIPYKIYTEDFLAYPAVNSKPGDYDTIGILYIITPDEKTVEINRYFKDGERHMLEEIDEAEYKQRKEAVKSRTEENGEQS